jgi:predicted RNA binding protein YcfA (HicA-like mRNA interferase family)
MCCSYGSHLVDFRLKLLYSAYRLMQSDECLKMLRAIKDDGWFQVARSGSHLQFKHPTKPGRVTVAG